MLGGLDCLTGTRFRYSAYTLEKSISKILRILVKTARFFKTESTERWGFVASYVKMK